MCAQVRLEAPPTQEQQAVAESDEYAPFDKPIGQIRRKGGYTDVLRVVLGQEESVASFQAIARKRRHYEDFQRGQIESGRSRQVTGQNTHGTA